MKAIECIYPDTIGTITKIIPFLEKNKEQMASEEIHLLKEKLAADKSRRGQIRRFSVLKRNEFRHYHNKLVRRMEEME